MPVPTESIPHLPPGLKGRPFRTMFPAMRRSNGGITMIPTIAARSAESEPVLASSGRTFS
jgi:hypothetical protein